MADPVITPLIVRIVGPSVLGWFADQIGGSRQRRFIDAPPVAPGTSMQQQGPDRVAPGPPRVVSTPPLIPSPVIPTTPGSTPPIGPGPGTPAFPGGGSVVDQIPPRVSVGGTAAAVARSILRGGWIGALFYPSSTSSADVVCIDTKFGPWCPPGLPSSAIPNVAIPRPTTRPAGPGRRARPRAVPGAPPRRRERPRTLPAPAAPAIPRGRPVTISRPVAQAQPLPRDIVRASPPLPTLPAANAPLPDPDSARTATSGSRPQSQPVPSPARTPAPSVPLPQVTLNALLLGLPMIGQLASGASRSIYRNPAISRPGISPTVGSITLPNVGPSPLAQPNARPQPLTANNVALAPSAAQDLDRQCRERAKQKRKRKKRKDRTICYRGTFYELKNGTRKQRKEKIPCR